MRVRTGALASLLLLAGAQPAYAQKAGTVEIGAFGRFTKFESKLNFDDRFGVGGRLGVFLLSNLAIEGDASYTTTKSQGGVDVQYLPIHARLVYGIPVSEHSAVLLGAGYVRTLFRKGYRETSNGVGGLLGVRVGLGTVLALRLDATGDYIPRAESATLPPQLAGIQQKKSNVHLGGQAGLSLLIGANRNGDHDRDGVKDSMDACPGTLAGDAVDARGCSLPKDADRDGVMDYLDLCPNTPMGDQVDRIGCTVPRDADGDGVVDANDKCPSTPAGTAVDATGCPRDADGDGVADALDRCPNTTAGTVVDATGCPNDLDHDGVVDTFDRCLGTPAGVRVDVTGCPWDGDADGVPDAADKCPNTPVGTNVDAVGCTVLFRESKGLLLQGVNFRTGKSILLPESRVILDRVAESLVANPHVRVEVGGHTDITGNKATNQRLSQARAEAVRQYLISRGVAPDRITAKGYASTRPIADNTSVEGRAANRRVELYKTN
jgi:outer membrane protein OmpA-like peptidoglycan-associated protein